MSTKSLVCLLLAAAAPAPAQSFNIDIGLPGSAPPSTYAAAGQSGLWMSIPATQGVTYFNLTDVFGRATSARVSQVGGTETVLLSDPAVTGDHALLMNDCIITHTAVENCLFFNDLEPGWYDVILYARMPAQPGVLCQTNVDQEPGNPHSLVGGAWPGQHELLVSYSYHMAEVAASGPTAGKLGPHGGVAPGGDFGIGAALNGVQIRKIPACAEDINGDGEIGIEDLLALILAWGACNPFCPADVTGDDVVDVSDLLAVILAWGRCVH